MKIKKLQLFSARIQEQYRFYRDTLGFPITEYSENRFTVSLGYSVLEFHYKKSATPYHVAFHIPDKQEEQALSWVKERVPILLNENDEIVDFSAWKAKSLYFYDVDKNILEFISRRNFHKPDSDIFTEKSVLGIAEIGLVTDDVKEKFDFLKKEYDLKKYDGDFEKFCAIGDDEGLFITINGKKKDWFPTHDKALKSEFCTEFILDGEEYSIKFEEDWLHPVQK